MVFFGLAREGRNTTGAEGGSHPSDHQRSRERGVMWGGGGKGKGPPPLEATGFRYGNPSSGHHNQTGSNLPRSLGRCLAPPANAHGGCWRSGSAATVLPG